MLRSAIIAGVEVAVRHHVIRGDDLNGRDRDGYTALMIAALRNRAHLCAILLNAGADATLLDPQGRTAEMLARGSGAREAAALLEVFSRRRAADIADSTPGPAHASRIVTLNPPANGGQPGDDAPKGESLMHVGRSADPPPDVDPGPAQSGTHDEFSELANWASEDSALPVGSDPSLLKRLASWEETISSAPPAPAIRGWLLDTFDLPEAAVRMDDSGTTQLAEFIENAIDEGFASAEQLDALCFDQLDIEGAAADDLRSHLTAIFEICGIPLEANWPLSALGASPSSSPGDVSGMATEALRVLEDRRLGRQQALSLLIGSLGARPLLTADQELELARRMARSVRSAVAVLGAWEAGVTILVEQVERAVAAEILWSDVFESGIAEEDAQSVAESDDALESPAAEDDGAVVSPASSRGQLVDKIIGLAAQSRSDSAARQRLQELLAGTNLSRNLLVAIHLRAVADGAPAADAFHAAAQDYIAARDALVGANVRLVVHMARSYLASGIPHEDLIQDGNLGLMRAVDRYDPTLGYRFSTYATWWIRQAITRGIADKARTIRVPVHLVEKVSQARRILNALDERSGREARIAILAAELEVSDRGARLILGLQENSELLPFDPLDDIEDLPASLIDEEADPLMHLLRLDATIVVADALAGLPERDRRVMELRFGLGGDDPMTLEQVGAQFDVTRERIRQIEAKCLRKLAHPARSARLLTLLDGPPQATKSEDAS